MSNATKLRDNLAKGDLILCMALLQARTPDIPLMAAACGFDAIYVDMEHSPASFETASMLAIAARGAGIHAIARVPSHHAHDATRLLDGGASGLLFPHVNSAAEATEIVRSCCFPPRGTRSMIGATPSLGYRSMKARDQMRALEDQLFIIAMVETPEGVANADAIAAVDGIDMVLVGTADLSATLGIPADFTNPRIADCVKQVSEACQKNKKYFGIGGIRNNHQLHSEFMNLGTSFIIAGSDSGYLLQAASADADALRGLWHTRS